MIKAIVGLALAGIALTPYAEKAQTAAAEQQIGIDPMETSSMKPLGQTAFEVATLSGGKCLVSVDWRKAGVVSVQDACVQVFEGLETVSTWTEASGGSVHLKDTQGATILEIGASDGFAYESISPAVEVVTFTPVES
jgi:hypothetical protein